MMEDGGWRVDGMMEDGGWTMDDLRFDSWLV